tara:strand:+ start:1460 stop:1576 length:117 start_codon:yes stop_codon:yes gene_type:complete
MLQEAVAQEAAVVNRARQASRYCQEVGGLVGVELLLRL